jgi:hypothetical protein
MEKSDKREYHPCDQEKGFCPPLAECLRQIGPGPGLFALYITNGANLTLKQIQKLNIHPSGVYYRSGPYPEKRRYDCSLSFLRTTY